ncbi:MAG TPA: hypothetical protein VHZ51_27820 [Ktedonobacteraceae bacterium]|jgi:hypothetical protein|nr:hypothetical protein [Ktedonobacteraceae bacterium]
MRNAVFDDFQYPLDQHWTQTCVGNGALAVTGSALRMSVGATKQGTYADAQIDDYGTLARAAFPWRPPLHMEVRARASLAAATTWDDQRMLRGTAGFGFWNYPFSVRGDLLMLPEAIWFFYASPPSNMALVPDVPGWGWKAQVVHSMRREALFATMPTALATGWGLLTGRTQSAARWLQRLSGTSETLLSTPLTEWHTYTLDWSVDAALFAVDGQHVLRVPYPPTRPLGFVAWLDNQYAVVSPRGVFRFGTVGTDDEWFEMDSVRIEPRQGFV